MPFFIIFLSIPLIELALFIMVGQAIGIGPTLLLVVASAVLGSIIIQNQGISVLETARNDLDRGRMPQASLFVTLCNVVAGLLLIVPGFFTDILALALLVPGVRHYLRHRVARHFDIDLDAQSDIITAEYEIIAEETQSPPPPRLPDIRP